MKGTDLSPQYYVAEASVGLLGLALVLWQLFGVAPGQPIPLLNLTLADGQHAPSIVAVLMVAITLYMEFEWRQSSEVADLTTWHTTRLVSAGLWTIVSLWVAYPLLFQGTKFEAVSPAWYVGFAVIGFLLGLAVSSLAIAALMIRTPEEAKKLRCKRMPVATRAQFDMNLLVIPLLLIAYFALLSYSPTVIHGVVIGITEVFYLLLIGEGLVWLFMGRDKDGNPISYAERVARFKDIFGSHDYIYSLYGRGKRAADDLEISPSDSPKVIQEKIREDSAVSKDQAPIGFHVEQRDEMQIKPYQKDGDLKNNDPLNLGFRVRNGKGKHGTVRVVAIPDDPTKPKRELAINTEVVEKHAEEYVKVHSDPEDLSFQKIFSHAVNTAVIEVMTDEAGPPLHRLVRTGQEQGVAELLKQKPDVNEKAEAGWTPLLFAAAQGYPRIVRMLLEAGANPEICNLRGITPLTFGARYGNLDVCKNLLEFGADVDAPDQGIEGNTALMWASYNGNFGLVRMLLKAKANPLIKSRKGQTALDMAQDNGHGEIAKLLRAAIKVRK